MGVLAILFHLGAEISGISLREEDEAFIFLAVALSTYAIFLGIAITAMIRQMFAETQATIDTIRAASQCISCWVFCGPFCLDCSCFSTGKHWRSQITRGILQPFFISHLQR